MRVKAEIHFPWTQQYLDTTNCGVWFGVEGGVVFILNE